MEPSRDNAEASGSNEVEVVMDDMEECTVNDDLRACGLLGDVNGDLR
jgi:hypothetical protein